MSFTLDESVCQGSRIIRSGIEEGLPCVLEHPPFTETIGEHLVTGFVDFFCSFLQAVEGLREFSDADFFKNIFVVEQTEVIALDGETVNFIAAHHHAFNSVSHGFSSRFIGEVVGVIEVHSDFLTRGGTENVGGGTGIDLRLQQGRVITLGGFIVDGDIRSDSLVFFDQGVDSIGIFRAGDKHIDIRSGNRTDKHCCKDADEQ